MAPLAVKTTGVPAQTVEVFGVTVKVNAPPIEILAVADPVQVPIEPKIV